MLVVLKRLLRGGLAEERLEEGMGAWGRGGPGTCLLYTSDAADDPRVV